jgi:uncharacterized GH25 family protein
MTRPRILLGVALLALTVASTGRAHDLKVLASRLTFDDKGGKSTIYLSWGHRLPVDDLVDGNSVERYDLIAPDGTTTALKKDERSLQANTVSLSAAGVYQAIVVRKSAVLTFVEDAEGNRVMKRGAKNSIKEGEIDYGFRSQQFGKVLLVAGAPKDGAIKPEGLPLEIVPVEGPSGWKRGDVQFRVLFQGKPLGEETLTATRVGFEPADAWCFATHTNHDGLATIRAAEAGTWVLRVAVRKPTGSAVRDQYDYEWYTSTLTLEIRP